MEFFTIQSTLANCSFFVLFLVTVWLYSEVFFNIKPFFDFFPFYGIFLVNGLLILIFIFRFKEENHFPLSNLYESVLFLSWALTCIYLVLKRDRRFKIIDLVIPPFLLFLTAFANYVLPSDLQKTSSLVPALQSNWLIMHVTIMMVSYAALITGSLFAFSFLVVGFFQKENYRDFTNLVNGSDEKDVSDSLNGPKVPPNSGNGSPLELFYGNGSEPTRYSDNRSELSNHFENGSRPKDNSDNGSEP